MKRTYVRSLSVVLAGGLFAVIVGFGTYIWATAAPLHPQPQSVPSPKKP